MGLHRRAVIANAKFIYKADHDQLDGKLRYFQYRDDKQNHLPQRGEERRLWVDRGLGETYGEIAQTATALATVGLTRDIAARTLVIAPQMDFMSAIPEAMRPGVLAELTDRTVEQWFAQANLPAPEYSYIMHRGDVADTRPDGREKDVQRAEEYYHTHVVLAATLPGNEHEREAYRVYASDERLPKSADLNCLTLTGLHEAARENMERIWERELGRDRVHALNQDLEHMTQDLTQRDIARATPERQTVEKAAQEIRQFWKIAPMPERAITSERDVSDKAPPPLPRMDEIER